MTCQEMMKILRDECTKELNCAMQTEKLLKKTFNPFTRYKLRKTYDMFMEHHIGILLAILRIEKEIKKENQNK